MPFIPCSKCCIQCFYCYSAPSPGSPNHFQMSAAIYLMAALGGAYGSSCSLLWVAIDLAFQLPPADCTCECGMWAAHKQDGSAWWDLQLIMRSAAGGGGFCITATACRVHMCACHGADTCALCFKIVFAPGGMGIQMF